MPWLESAKQELERLRELERENEAKKKEKMKIRATGPGIDLEFPSQAACARNFRVSTATIGRLIESGEPFGDIHIERIRPTRHTGNT